MFAMGVALAKVPVLSPSNNMIDLIEYVVYSILRIIPSVIVRVMSGKSITARIVTSPVIKSSSISANTAL